MATTSLGYNVPADDTISLLSYDISVDGVSILVDDAQSSSATWSDQSTVTAYFELEVDLEEVLRQSFPVSSGSAGGAVLGTVINWKSSRTGLHGASAPVTLVDGINTVNLSLDGSTLGGDLNLRASVILLENPGATPDDLGPTMTGSRLWENSIRVQLEGAGSQFPTSAFDFEKAGYSPTHAMWRIDIDSALESHISSAVRLKLNSGHPRVAEYLLDPNGKTQAEFQQFLRADTVVQMLTFALNSDLAQLEEDSAEEGTLAETLKQMHDVYFSNVSIHSTRELYLADPSFVTATVQASIFNPNRRMGK
ncbi:hypothetical protein EAH68_01320 [Corynebacterium hylobatis]|uniref:Uncharacterized protein n=1 Tax=Corynebacterium hylobatis TaxID=1859290 RepID=A0A430I103_9CORY|nr:hypothetical protein [Corynebacterium hylobatis]RSZ65430.1 hypothetical protein EAH68_01320 [Corynebacterium hylobatis]